MRAKETQQWKVRERGGKREGGGGMGGGGGGKEGGERDGERVREREIEGDTGGPKSRRNSSPYSIWNDWSS